MSVKAESCTGVWRVRAADAAFKTEARLGGVNLHEHRLNLASVVEIVIARHKLFVR
jgi:hypothetical protein